MMDGGLIESFLVVLEKQIVCPDGLSVETIEWCRNQFARCVADFRQQGEASERCAVSVESEGLRADS